MDNFKALKNKLVQELVQFIKEIARNETYQNIGRELLKVVVEINKRAISGNLNQINIIARVIKVIAFSVKNLQEF